MEENQVPTADQPTADQTDDHGQAAMERGAGVPVPVASGVSATVVSGGTEPTTMMYLKSASGVGSVGVPVPNSEIETFRNKGFLLHQPSDLAALCDECDHLAAAVTDSARSFVADVLEKKQIGNDEQSTARALQIAMVQLNGRLQDILNIANENYPVAELGETTDEFAHRVAAESAWHGYSEGEITRRYGLFGQDGVVATIISLMPEKPKAPTTEPHVQLESGEWVPSSQASGPYVAKHHGNPDE